MELYADKLPDTCANCKCVNVFEDTDGRINHVCNILNQVVSVQKRLSNCPLKQLTNQQLAIGWLGSKNKIQGDNKEIKYLLSDDNHLLIQDIDERVSYWANNLYKELFTNTWTLLEKPLFIYTDWKGAREAAKEDKKVTHVWSLAPQIEDGLLMYSESSTFSILHDDTHWAITDKLYDSTEWKVWS